MRRAASGPPVRRHRIAYRFVAPETSPSTIGIPGRSAASRMINRPAVLDTVDGVSDLFDRIEIPLLVGGVFPDAQGRLVRKVIWRDRQIIGRGDRSEHSARQIVFRPVTRAEIPAEPIRRRIGRIGVGKKARDAAQMGADPDQNRIFGARWSDASSWHRAVAGSPWIRDRSGGRPAWDPAVS